ncbi:MAG: cytochrome c3 family protein [Desulfobulbales bacterium]|nr:cytochrome c3 family protein [Desulfobulbales bacterium]
MSAKKAILLAASLLAISLWGCSTDFDARDDQASPAAEASLVGAGNCIGCHGDAALSTVASPQVVNDYLAGKHVIHSTHIDAAAGDCLECHDPLGDGPSLEQFITDASAIPLAGLAAVTCETCHGGGGDHVSGKLPVPYPTPDYNRCGQCHNATVDHHTYHPEADSIVEKVGASPHFTGVRKTEAPCAKCHSDEGAKLYKNVAGTPAELETNITTDLASASPIQCRTCHEPHSLNLLLAAADGNSTEYNTCTNCHQTVDAYHGETGSVGLDLARVIYDTHFDDPTTLDIEGYNLGPDHDPDDLLTIVGSASERVCRDCHDVHAADTTINNQWANSGHGGHIAKVKKDAKEASGAVAALTAAVDSTTGDAWLHYDWKDTSSRGRCQRCHTATGARNYLEAMADNTPYDPNNNDFSYLGVSNAKEMLYCWGCHANNSGDLRNPGGVTLEYTVADSPVVLPNLGNSNVCVPCHAGRGNMDSYGLSGDPLTTMTTKPGFGPGTQNVTATHYLAASATIYQALTKVGYHYYPAVDYADKRWYGHKTVGLNGDSPETGSGPCVACHMSDKNHNLDVVAKDGSGVMTELKGTICVTCHDGEHALFVAQSLVGTTQNIWNGTTAIPTMVTQKMADDSVAELKDEGEGFHEALEILEQQLQTKGLTFDPLKYPYFSGAGWIDEGTFGAAHNLNYLHHEPGAYAHNRYYAKRLIFDSIDWLDNGVLDGTVNIDAVTYPDAAAWFKAAETADAAAVPPINIGDASRP